MPVWMLIVEWLARGILLLLLGLSVWSISIMIDRKRLFKKYQTSKPLSFSGATGPWESLSKEITQENSAPKIERKHENTALALKEELSQGLGVLGSLGGTAPFIGLLGTVLGIIKAFGDLSMNSQNTNKVMFLLAEALILTAVGLAVAIPAVIAFNHFQRKLKSLLVHLGTLKNDYLNSLES